MVEMRWYDTGVRKVLQYRFYSDVGGPYPNYQRIYRDWETDRKSTRLNSSHRL